MAVGASSSHLVKPRSSHREAYFGSPNTLPSRLRAAQPDKAPATRQQIDGGKPAVKNAAGVAGSHRRRSFYRAQAPAAEWARRRTAEAAMVANKGSNSAVSPM